MAKAKDSKLRKVELSTWPAWYISSATPITVAMLVFFHRLRVCEISGGTVIRKACGRITSRMLAR
ncbi:Uncharacterised protein [Klebsiella pneumoniae]|nr:Uncharacterised protein [Klebsiella pneumoniae]